MDKLRLVPIGSGNVDLPAPRALNPNYVGPVRRLLKSLDRRCGLLWIRPCAEEAVRQMELRSLVLNQGTVWVELLAMRQLTRLMQESRGKAESLGLTIGTSDCAPRNAVIPLWLRFADRRSIERLSDQLHWHSRARLKEAGAAILAEQAMRLTAVGDVGTEAEIRRKLAGVQSYRSSTARNRRLQANRQPITGEMLEAMEARMQPGTPEEGVQSLIGGRPNYGAVTRLIARAAWLTGMRSVEIFSCRLVIVSPRAEGCGISTEEVLENPGKFTREGLLDDASEQQLDRLAATRSFGGVAPPAGLFLVISTAKTRNSSPLIDNSIRFQRLDGMPCRDFRCLRAASRLRSLPPDPRRLARVRLRSTMILKRISSELFPGRPAPITLHSFRHAFVHAARSAMRPEEVAALTGHTSLKIMKGYGGWRTARQTGTGGRWMPQPDPSRADEISKAWALKARRPSPKPEIREPEFELELGCGF